MQAQGSLSFTYNAAKELIPYLLMHGRDSALVARLSSWINEEKIKVYRVHFVNTQKSDKE